ncbi:MAG: ATP-dependent zinc metalloprotease FtsH [Clostridiales bacterium]|nr:ATP-dependent zinc metalloprotease FtsH [Clostridiales bacterium]
MKEQPDQRKPILYYSGIVIILMLLLNIFVFPALLQAQVTEVTYDQFLSLVEEGRVTDVAYEDNQIRFIVQEDGGRPALCKTGVWPWDDSLTDKLLAKNVRFAASIPTQASPLMSLLVSLVLPMAVFILIGRLLMNSMSKRMGGTNALTLGKANAKIYIESQTGKTFMDVAGQGEAKEALTEIVDFLHDPGKYAEIGAKLPKGALLVGPPGTGKTLLAKAVAGEAKVPFFSISGSEFVEMFVGMGAAKVRDLFKQAEEKAPCIVFIDEIDTIGKKRDSGGLPGGNDEREQTLNQLLAEMDGFDGRKGVVILAATNRPEILDPALLRPGRFDRRIPVELPDLQGRLAILKVHAKNVKMDGAVDLSAVARATSGASGAELANIINEAALRAVRVGHSSIHQSDLEESVETVIAGYQRKGAVISDREKKIIAYHEIGHALVAARQKNAAPVTKITIIPRTSGALGYTMQVEEDERVLLSREDAMQQLTTLTGGRTAEELVFHTVTSGASNDIEKATRLARSMVTRFGMSGQFDMVALETVTNQYLGGDTSLACSAETAAKIDAEVNAIVKEAHDQAREILSANMDQLHRLAAYLLEKETITGEEFMRILNEDGQKEG